MPFFRRGKTMKRNPTAEKISVDRVLRQFHGETRTVETVEEAPIREALKAIAYTVDRLRGARHQLKNIAETVIAASAEPDLGTRALLAENYDDERAKLIHHLREQDRDTANLVSDTAQSINIQLIGGGQYCVAANPLVPLETGLQLPPPQSGFSSQKEVSAILTQIDYAFGKIERVLKYYRRDREFLEKRLHIAKTHGESALS